MKQLIPIICLVAICFTASYGQLPTIQWAKCFGSFSRDEGACGFQTLDGGYFFTGQITGGGGDVINGLGSSRDGGNFWAVKTDSLGTIQWHRQLGGGQDDYPYKAVQTPDSGYVLCGYTESTNTRYPWDTDLSAPNKGIRDWWIVKISKVGSVVWQYNYGSASSEEALSIKNTLDGGFIVAGWTNANNSGDVPAHAGSAAAWLLKLNSDGSIAWKKCYGGSLIDYAFDVVQTANGGYAFTGYSKSNDNGLSNKGGFDYYVVKTDNNGNIIWQKTFGGVNDDRGNNIIQTNDGGFLGNVVKNSWFFL